MSKMKSVFLKVLNYIKLLFHHYFQFCGLLLDVVQEGAKIVFVFMRRVFAFLFRYFIEALKFVCSVFYEYFLKLIYDWILKPIGHFFRFLNKNPLLHIIFIPFMYVAKLCVFIYMKFHRSVTDLTMAQKKAITGYGFLSPWILGFLGLVVYPIGLLVFKSFNNVRQSGGDYNYTWVGFDNYHRILRIDIDFVVMVQDFIVKVLLYTPVIIALAVIIAMLLNQGIKGKGFFRMVFFLPIIILNGQLLSTMSENGGMDIHLSPFVIDMLTTIVPVFALDVFIGLFSIIIEILWYTGVPILIFLAMLQKIDKSLYEAASIDGANAWSIFWKVTLPIIRPAISVAIIFIVVFLANFDGNPINREIVRSNGDPSRYQGYAAAMAIIYSFIQIIVISMLLLLTRQRNKKGRI